MEVGTWFLSIVIQCISESILYTSDAGNSEKGSKECLLNHSSLCLVFCILLYSLSWCRFILLNWWKETTPHYMQLWITRVMPTGSAGSLGACAEGAVLHPTCPAPSRPTGPRAHASLLPGQTVGGWLHAWLPRDKPRQRSGCSCF